MKPVTAFNLKKWMFRREAELLTLNDHILEPYQITDEDTQIETTGAMLFNSISSRLHTHLYNNFKLKYEYVTFTIPHENIVIH